MVKRAYSSRQSPCSAMDRFSRHSLRYPVSPHFPDHKGDALPFPIQGALALSRTANLMSSRLSAFSRPIPAPDDLHCTAPETTAARSSPRLILHGRLGTFALHLQNPHPRRDSRVNCHQSRPARFTRRPAQSDSECRYCHVQTVSPVHSTAVLYPMEQKA
jgi:hypothetical protein